MNALARSFGPSARVPLQLGAALLLVGATAVLADTEDELEKKMAATAGGSLVVEVEFGAVDVSTHDAAEVKVNAWRKVRRASKEEEETFLKNRPVEISQDGDTITVRAIATEKDASRSKGPQTTQGKFHITVPTKFNLRVSTAGGAISVRDLEGSVRAQTRGGDLAFEHVKGPVDGQTAGGAIRLANCEGNLAVKTGGGKIVANDGRGNLNGKTGGGTVSVTGFAGPVSVQSGGGSIDLDDVAGTITGQTGGGSINARLSKLSEDVKLQTAGGGVTLRAPADAAFTLDASSTGGSVSSDLNVSSEGKPSRQHLRGAVNGGGKQVTLRTAGGSVQVKKL